ncbi:MAG: dephospho-CoA kinase [Candidatus Scalinduaceae bacterium]
MNGKIKVIGIMGGIASGKSTVAKMLRSLGASVVDADKICHQLINTEEINKKISKKWGGYILNKHGKINRCKLGKIVFSDKRELLTLNKIIHPKAIKQIKSRITELNQQGTKKGIVLDVALLVESNLTSLCDIIIFVDSKRQICKKRVQQNRKWPSSEINKREMFQGSLREKKENADIVINNNSSKEDTFKQVKDFWNQFIIK